ncbi:MAG: hypothetical protein ABI692_00545 [Terracoccus sp.]
MIVPRIATAGLSAVALSFAVLTAPTASAVQQPAPPPSASAMVSAVPAANTPAVDDGDVRGIAKVGDTMVIGGNFTSVAGQPRARLAAFSATTGALSPLNLPVNGEVSSVVPGPTADTAYIGGDFTTVGSVARRNLALVNLTTSAVVTAFIPPTFSSFGRVKDMVKVGSRIFIVGDFTTVGGQTRPGIAALSATTGAVDQTYLTVKFAGHHNNSGSGAQGSVGPWNIDVTAAGDRLAVIGNFKTADGLARDQVALITLGATSAKVTPDWNTNRYNPLCLSNAFDSYVRGVSFSPNGSYFVIAATGGGIRDSLCDAAARFETYATGTDIQPTWVSETGGDTMWGAEITDNAVYVGGHQRWGNNPYGRDFAGPGAVPRPGLVALDPASGRPLQWNPGRNPPGKAVYAVLATSEGLWVGSNTDYVGNYKYLRKKVALFPYVGGGQLAATNVGTLPGIVVMGGSVSGTTSDSLSSVGLTSSGISSQPAPAADGGVAWSSTRGAFMVGNKVFYALTDGYLYSRTLTGGVWGTAVQINPYHDPVWATVSNHLGGTFDGNLPTIYGQIPSLTGMVYSNGRLYYTLSGDPTLRWRWFSPDSGIVDERTFTVTSSVDFRSTRGLLIAGSNLYYSATNDSSLYRVAWNGSSVVGASTRISGPSLDGVSWANRSLFLLSSASG